jgi:hypothetical protein
LAAVALIPNSFWINRLHLFCFSLHNWLEAHMEEDRYGFLFHGGSLTPATK